MLMPIIIPSLDPDKSLSDYCRALRERTDELILLVDDGSAANNRVVFETCKANVTNLVVLHHERNYGKGRALKTAFAWLLENRKDFSACVTVDSDGQHLVPDVMRCIEASRNNPQALVLGCRVFSGDHVPWKSSFGNNLMTFCFLAVTGRKFMDTQTGLRVIPKVFIRRLLNFPGDRFEFETEMLLGMMGVPLVQVPITTVYENGNKSTHFRPLVDSWKVVRVILKSGMRRMGLFVLSSLSSFVIDVGIFYLLYETVFNSETRGRLWWAIFNARGVSMIYNYLINEIFVFELPFAAGGLRSEFFRFVRYLALAAVVLLGAYFITKGLCATLPSVPVVVLKVLSDLVMFIVAYLVQRVYIFKQDGCL